jgi:hypothetical protein
VREKAFATTSVEATDVVLEHPEAYRDRGN